MGASFTLTFRLSIWTAKIHGLMLLFPNLFIAERGEGAVHLFDFAHG